MRSRRGYCMQPAIYGGSVEEAALHRVIGTGILGRRMKWLVQWGDKTWKVGEMNSEYGAYRQPKMAVPNPFLCVLHLETRDSL